MISGMPGVTDQQRKFFSDYVGQGGDPNTFMPEVMKAIFPTNKQATGPRELAAGALGLPMDSTKWSKEDFQKVADWETTFKTKGQKPPESLQDKLNLYTQERQIAQQFKTPPKSVGQIQAESAARAKGTLSALSGAPLSRFGAVGLSNDGSLRLEPTATQADADAGKVLPVLKTDIKQLRQAQTAKLTLDEFEKTITEALPKDPGMLSASGMLGRKVTEVVNPTKLAKFNAARFGAADHSR